MIPRPELTARVSRKISFDKKRVASRRILSTLESEICEFLPDQADIAARALQSLTRLSLEEMTEAHALLQNASDTPDRTAPGPTDSNQRVSSTKKIG